MLLVAPNRSVDLEGLIGPVGPIGAVESNGISTELCGRIVPMQPVLRGLSILPAVAVAAAAAPPQSIRIDAVGLGGRSASAFGSSCVDEVSFKIKDTFHSFQSTRESRNAWS